MAYTSFKDLPIYFNIGTAVATPAEDNVEVVHATQGQFNYTPNLTQTRLLGQSPNKNNFALAGPPGATLSFSAYLKATGGTTDFDPLDYTGTAGVNFAIGSLTAGISGTNAFLTSFSYTVVPYQPVLINCEFQIFDPPEENRKIAVLTSAVSDTTMSDYAHGAYSESTIGSAIPDMGLVESINYSFSTQRLPIYQINSRTVNSVQQVTAEQSFAVVGDNITDLIPITGEVLQDFSITLKTPGGSTALTTNGKGTMVAENISITAGDVARGSVTITEPLL